MPMRCTASAPTKPATAPTHRGQRRVGHAFENHGQHVAADAGERVDERGPLQP